MDSTKPSGEDGRRRISAVRRGDKEIVAVNNSLFRELLTYMMEDPRNISVCIHLLFCTKNIEQMGDHAANIAEITRRRASRATTLPERVPFRLHAPTLLGHQAWGGFAQAHGPCDSVAVLRQVGETIGGYGIK